MSFIRGRWPRLVIEFMDGKIVEFEFSDDNPGYWEPSADSLIVAENTDDGIRHVYPHINIRRYTVVVAAPESLAIDTAIKANTDRALDWSSAIDAFRQRNG